MISMKSLNEKLTGFSTELASVGEHVYHYTKSINSGYPYIVWAEQGESDGFHSDNRKSEQTISVTVDLYTRSEFDPLVDQVQSLLNEKSRWRLNSVQYEDETTLIHYEWECEL